jgi:uncharacterized protein (TIGR02172 family)
MQSKRLIGQGRTAEIFEINKDKVVKLFRKEFPLSLIENEFKISKKLRNENLPIPNVFELTKIENRTGIIYERIDGKTMMEIISKNPWRTKTEARRLAELHKSIQIPIESVIPSQDSLIRSNIQENELLSERIKTNLIDYLDKLPQDKILCHGDFHPDNVIISKNKFFIIDWMSATLGNPLSDVARTSVIFKFGIIPEHESRIKIEIINFIRKKYYTEYIEHYLKISHLNKVMIENWEIPVAAARLSEKIPLKEKEKLLEFINKHFA